MIGEASRATFAYSPEASAFTQDTGVKVTVMIGERDIPADVVRSATPRARSPAQVYG